MALILAVLLTQFLEQSQSASTMRLHQRSPMVLSLFECLASLTPTNQVHQITSIGKSPAQRAQ